MTYKWNKDYNRFAIAQNILLQIVDSIYAVNNEVEFGVRLYGTDYPAQEKNCTDSKLLVPFNLQNAQQIKRSLQFSNPIGWSPIAYSLRESAENEINNTALYDYSIIFITDGGESCGGDICQTFLDLLKNKISITPYIIGLDKNKTLKTYYDCLGKFVSVLDVNDIPTAVKLIVDANRPILNKKKNLNLNTVFSNSPVKKDSTIKVKKVVKAKPKVKRVSSRLKELPYLTQLLPKLKLSTTQPISIRPVFDKVEYRFSVEPTAQRTRVALQTLEPLEAKVIVQGTVSRAMPIALQPLYSKTEYRFDIPKPEVIAKKSKPITLEALRPFEPRHRLVYAFKIPRPIFLRYPYQALVYEFTLASPAVAKKPVVKKTVVKKQYTNPKVDNSAVAVSQEVIPNPETLVQIFFVNKFQRKKSYGSATPTIIQKEATTKREVQRFIRTVNRGQPEMKSIKAGTYFFTVNGSQKLTTRAVKISANSINKVFIEVTDGTLEFVYANNSKRAVKEFQAIVNPRFENRDKTVIQECKDQLYYSPGTYYIEINTKPPLKYAMYDISFGAKHIVQVPEPGFVQIVNTNRVGKVEFTHYLNDADARFHIMTVNGNLLDQKEMMRPGNYKAFFDARPGVPQAGKKFVKFKIISNKTTEIELK